MHLIFTFPASVPEVSDLAEAAPPWRGGGPDIDAPPVATAVLVLQTIVAVLATLAYTGTKKSMEIVLESFTHKNRKRKSRKV